jgi:MFS family permease
MLGIIIMIAVGRQFYELAKKYEQQQAWVYAILGVVSYYVGGFIGGLILLILSEILGVVSIDNISDLSITFISIALGVISCWGFYQLLKSFWKKKFEEAQRLKPKISDIGKSEEQEKPKESFLIGNKDLGDLGKKKDDNWRF